MKAAETLAAHIIEDFTEKDDTKEELPKAMQIGMVAAAIEYLILDFAS